MSDNFFKIKAQIDNWDVDEVDAASLYGALTALANNLEADADRRQQEANDYRRQAVIARAAAKAARETHFNQESPLPVEEEPDG